MYPTYIFIIRKIDFPPRFVRFDSLTVPISAGKFKIL